MTTNLLMCKPDFFKVSYEINPWMHVYNKVNEKVALEQWETVVQNLENLNVKIDLIEQDKNLPDEVFTANFGVAFNKKFLASNFKYEERQPEKTEAIEWFQKNTDYDVVELPEKFEFEGKGDMLYSKNTAVIANGYRTSDEAINHIKNIFPEFKKYVRVKLINPNFYHLDTCFSFLNEKTIMFYPEAFEKEQAQQFYEITENVIEISKEDAEYFACNNVTVKNKILLNKASQDLQDKLNSYGFEPIFCPTSEFMKAGGSIRCMVLDLD